MFLTNPFMSQWLSLANAAAGTMRGQWIGQMHRQQTAVVAEMTRQATRFWSGPWMAQIAFKSAPAALEAVERSVEQLRVVPALTSEATTDASAPAPAPLAAPTPTVATAPPVAQLRSRAERRSATPAKRKAATAANAKRATGKALSQRTARKAR